MTSSFSQLLFKLWGFGTSARVWNFDARAGEELRQLRGVDPHRTQFRDQVSAALPLAYSLLIQTEWGFSGALDPEREVLSIASLHPRCSNSKAFHRKRFFFVLHTSAVSIAYMFEPTHAANTVGRTSVFMAVLLLLIHYL